jgi:hypothetical protein
LPGARRREPEVFPLLLRRFFATSTTAATRWTPRSSSREADPAILPAHSADRISAASARRDCLVLDRFFADGLLPDVAIRHPPELHLSKKSAIKAAIRRH